MSMQPTDNPAQVMRTGKKPGWFYLLSAITQTPISPASSDDIAALIAAIQAQSGGSGNANAAKETGGNLAELVTLLQGVIAIAGSVNVANFPATQPVSGSVSVSNLPGTQQVAGSVSVSNLPTTQQISAASLPLPSGAAQENGNLAAILTKLTSVLGQLQGTLAISAASLPLPTGAATQATLASLLANTPLGQAVMAASRPVAIASDQSAIPVKSASLNATPIAAGKSTATVIKGAAGTLYGILITSSGLGIPQIFDNASTTAGTIVGTLAASIALGLQLFVQQGVACANGITVAGGSTMPGMTILWS